MRKLLLMCALALVCAGASAEEKGQKGMIYKANNEQIEAKILEVSSSEVKYKEWDNLDGPTFVLTAGEVKKVKLSDGTEQVYDTPRSAAKKATKSENSVATASSSEKKPVEAGFQCNIDFDGNLNFQGKSSIGEVVIDPFTNGGLSIGLGMGARIQRFLYIGVAANVTGNYGKTTVGKNGTKLSDPVQFVQVVVPIYGDVRLYVPTGGNCYPFAELGVGGYVGVVNRTSEKFINMFSDKKIVDNYKPKGGFYLTTGFGLEFKKTTIGIGYKYYKSPYLHENFGYVKLGVSLGRPAKIRN